MNFTEFLNQLQYGGKYKLYEFEIEFIKKRAEELGITISEKELKALEKRKLKIERESIFKD